MRLSKPRAKKGEREGNKFLLGGFDRRSRGNTSLYFPDKGGLTEAAGPCCLPREKNRGKKTYGGDFCCTGFCGRGVLLRMVEMPKQLLVQVKRKQINCAFGCGDSAYFVNKMETYGQSLYTAKLSKVIGSGTLKKDVVFLT